MEQFPPIIQMLILAVWMFAVPMLAGNCFPGILACDAENVRMKPVFCWVSGQMILWGGFQVICVPFILKGKPFHNMALVFLAYTAGLVFLGLILWIRGRRRSGKLHLVGGSKRRERCWIVFAALLAVQLVLAAGMAYADSDDAYYVAVSALTRNSDTMYQVLPYTGGTTVIDSRHGLAPFPVWIAFLSWVSGVHATIVAHVGVQLMLIPMMYGIFALLGKKLLPGRNELLPVFLIFVQLLVIFGGYSIYTMEHFVLARSRQGKAALSSIVIPFLFLLLLVLYEKLQEKEKCGWPFWLLLAATATAGCLCSTMGAILSGILLGVAGLCGAVCYRRWKTLIPIFCCCIPCLACLLLYGMLQ